MKKQNKVLTNKRKGLKGKHVEISGLNKLDPESYDLFVKSPLFWLSKSEELLRSASILQSYQNENIRNGIVGNNVFSVVRLLCGYSLENIFKAIIAPTATISISGQLPKELDSHDLKVLSYKAGLKLNKEQNKILEFLSEHIISYGRYHVQKNASKMKTNSKISATHNLFDEVFKIWKIARAKLPGYTIK